MPTVGGVFIVEASWGEGEGGNQLLFEKGRIGRMRLSSTEGGLDWTVRSSLVWALFWRDKHGGYQDESF